MPESYITIVSIAGGLTLPVLAIALCYIGVSRAVALYSRKASAALAARYESVEPQETPGEGLVYFDYPVYLGLLVWIVTVENRGYLPPDTARDLLKSLRSYNLRWGLVAAGGVFVPFLSFWHYSREMRSITRQEEAARIQSLNQE